MKLQDRSRALRERIEEEYKRRTQEATVEAEQHEQALVEAAKAEARLEADKRIQEAKDLSSEHATLQLARAKQTVARLQDQAEKNTTERVVKRAIELAHDWSPEKRREVLDAMRKQLKAQARQHGSKMEILAHKGTRYSDATSVLDILGVRIELDHIILEDSIEQRIQDKRGDLRRKVAIQMEAIR